MVSRLQVGGAIDGVHLAGIRPTLRVELRPHDQVGEPVTIEVSAVGEAHTRGVALLLTRERDVRGGHGSVQTPSIRLPEEDVGLAGIVGASGIGRAHRQIVHPVAVDVAGVDRRPEHVPLGLASKRRVRLDRDMSRRPRVVPRRGADQPPHHHRRDQRSRACSCRAHDPSCSSADQPTTVHGRRRRANRRPEPTRHRPSLPSVLSPPPVRDPTPALRCYPRDVTP